MDLRSQWACCCHVCPRLRLSAPALAPCLLATNGTRAFAIQQSHQMTTRPCFVVKASPVASRRRESKRCKRSTRCHPLFTTAALLRLEFAMMTSQSSAPSALASMLRVVWITTAHAQPQKGLRVYARTARFSHRIHVTPLTDNRIRARLRHLFVKVAATIRALAKNIVLCQAGGQQERRPSACKRLCGCIFNQAPTVAQSQLT